MSNKANLPDGWKWIRLGKIIKNLQNGFACGERDVDGIIQLRMNNVTRNGHLLMNEYIRVPKKYYSADYELKKGDILFNHTNSAELVGKCLLFSGYEEEVTFSNHFVRIGIDEAQISPIYLFFKIQQLWQNKYFEYHCDRWIGQAAFQPKKLIDVQIPLPSLIEQNRITAIIEKEFANIEKAKKAAEEQQAATGALVEAYLREVFNFDEMPKGWKIVKLKDICELARGGSPRPIQAFITNEENGVNWIKIGDADISSKYLETTSEKITPEGATHSRMVYPGDFILSNSMSFGRPYILKTEGCIHDGWLVLGHISDEVSQDYLYHVLSSTVVKQQFFDVARGAIVKNLNIEIVKEVKIPLPALPEQQRFVGYLESKFSSVEKIKTMIQSQCDMINAMPAAILRKAFAGEM